MNPFTQALEDKQMDKMVQLQEENEKMKNALEEINKLALYYDSRDWALNPDKIIAITTKALTNSKKNNIH